MHIKEVTRDMIGKCKECCLLNKYCFTMLHNGEREECIANLRKDKKNVVFKNK